MVILHKFDFSSSEYYKFINLCPFTDEEIKILDLRRKGKSILQISFETNLSDRTIERRLKSIQTKIEKEI